MPFQIPAGTNVHKTSNCRGCNAEILWIEHANRGGPRKGQKSKIPIDVPTLRKGDNGLWLGDAHWATCPKADEFQEGAMITYPLDTPIALVVGLPVRARKGLSQAGAEILSDVGSITESEFLVQRGVGYVTLHEVNELLKGHGLEWRDPGRRKKLEKESRVCTILEDIAISLRVIAQRGEVE